MQETRGGEIRQREKKKGTTKIKETLGVKEQGSHRVRVKQVEEKNGNRIWWKMKEISVASASRSTFPLMAKTTLGSFATVVTFRCT